MTLPQQFQEALRRLQLHPADPLLLAASGGLDSSVLAHLCSGEKIPFVLAHCNFGLRGAESLRDAAFVQRQAERYGVPCLVQSFDTSAHATANRMSVQEAARKLRYDWFEAERKRLSLQYPDKELWIATAHHLDDNIETMLMHFFQGTGITGLRGMLPKTGKIIRPLLFARKEALLQYAREEDLDWVEDSSNGETKYTRNYFRKEVIPVVRNVYPAAEENLAANLQRFWEAEQLYRQAVDHHKKRLLEFRGGEVHLPVLKLSKTEPLATITWEVIRDYGFTPKQVPNVLQLLRAETGKYVSSQTHRVLRNRNWLIIAPIQQSVQTVILVEEGTAEVLFGNRKLTIDKTDPSEPLSTDAQVAQLDEKEIAYPLLLRRWKAGDYFYPLGMKKKKKVARFLIDQRVSRNDKENVWVVESGKRIIWVVGYRIDDRFKRKESTGTVLRLTASIL